VHYVGKATGCSALSIHTSLCSPLFWLLTYHLTISGHDVGLARST
jgi:hypothetical protein